MTGIVTDVDAVSTLLHRHGALACWDYASAGPYLPIDMNPPPDANGDASRTRTPSSSRRTSSSAGPGRPGVLIAKRSLFRNRVPTVPGGGTILFVSPTRQTYHPDPEIREEGGTPAIVESIRAGLVFALKEAVGADEIRRREERLRAARARVVGREPAHPHPREHRRPTGWRSCRSASATGAACSTGTSSPRVLNDLFGIQARSGCFCAGPYVHRTYPIDDDWSERMDAEVSRGHVGAKLSFTRLGFNYFTSETVFDYILRAVHLVADEGWKLLPQYRFDPGFGAVEPPRSDHTAAHIPARRLVRGGRRHRWGRRRASTESEDVLPGYLEEARSILRDAEARSDGPPIEPPLSTEFERIRWFPLPGEEPPSRAREDERPERASSILDGPWRTHGASGLNSDVWVKRVNVAATLALFGAVLGGAYASGRFYGGGRRTSTC